MGGASSDNSNPLLSQSQPSIGIPVQPLPSDPVTAYILLPYYHRRRPRHSCYASLLSSSSLLILAFSLLSLFLFLFLFYPSDPHVTISRLSLHHIHVSALPYPTLSISLKLKVKIQNRDFFSLDYNSLVVSIGYRGKQLGFVTSDGGRIRARGVSYVDAEMKIDGLRIVGDAIYFIKDVARGLIPFETVTEVDGTLRLLFLDIPVDGKISCSINVNPENHTVVHQDCFPE